MAEVDYKALCAEYERRMGIGENDPAKDGYLVLVNQLKQRNEFLKEFKIRDHISNAVKDNPTYARAMDLTDGLPKMIEAVSNLKIALKMEGEEKKTLYKPISAKEIASGNV